MARQSILFSFSNYLSLLAIKLKSSEEITCKSQLCDKQTSPQPYT